MSASYSCSCPDAETSWRIAPPQRHKNQFLLTSVQCDEHKPTCKKCEKYGSSCSFLQTHPQKSRLPTVASMLASPEPTISSASSPASTTSLTPKFSLLDMELLHHWTTETCQVSIDFPAGIELHRTVIVQFGFDFPFLMHLLLAITARHLEHLRPQKQSTYKRAADSHAAAALSLFQPAIANFTPENCHPCFAFSSALGLYTWASQSLDKPSTLFFKPSSNYQSADIQWVRLHRGTATILAAVWHLLENGPCRCLWDDWKGLDEDRPDPLYPDDEIHFNQLPEAWKDLPEEQREVLDKNLKVTIRALSMVDFHLGPSKLASGISWFSHISDELVQMLSEKKPEALLIVCYYCLVLKRLSETWWMKGKAENLLRTVMTELGGGWETWTRWPVKKVLGADGTLPGLEYRNWHWGGSTSANG
jgi:Fungal specific transcription factor domain/Fungal Zn(2)-Cys(6) binuclear cluster domain